MCLQSLQGFLAYEATMDKAFGVNVRIVWIIKVDGFVIFAFKKIEMHAHTQLRTVTGEAHFRWKGVLLRVEFFHYDICYFKFLANALGTIWNFIISSAGSLSSGFIWSPAGDLEASVVGLEV